MGVDCGVVVMEGDGYVSEWLNSGEIPRPRVQILLLGDIGNGFVYKGCPP